MRIYVYLALAAVFASIVFLQTPTKELPETSLQEYREPANSDHRKDVVPPSLELEQERMTVHIPNPASRPTTPSQFHKTTVEEFENAEGFGSDRRLTYVLVDDGAVKFDTKSIQTLPASDQGHPELARTARQFLPDAEEAMWHVDLVQLISIDRFERPVAYDEKELPTMHALKEVEIATRSLDDFEMAAVEKLRQGEELVVESKLDRLNMVGAIHASHQCAECHNVPSGELLGAFTYQFSLVEPSRVR